MSVVPTGLAGRVWKTKYRFKSEATIADTWRRVACALASCEEQGVEAWQARFLEALDGFKFLPGGRILAGAGTSRAVTLFNCFVMGEIEDSMEGIFKALQESALTMQRGGGVGLDFSTLRPHGASVEATGSVASGPVSFMHVWDAMCATVMSQGARRGAMMATLRCDHPDIEEFVTAKRASGRLRHFNLSVLVTDAFMAAVRNGTDWPLRFPATGCRGSQGAVARRMPARDLWDIIARSAHACAEPGVLFVDRINASNTLAYCEDIRATNPCGEVPLPPYGACDLGSLNLTRFVTTPFTPEACIDRDGLRRVTQTAVRMLDNAIDVSTYPLAQQKDESQGARRIGLGVTGLADALIMSGCAYDAPDGRAVAADIMRDICHAAYWASIDLAREKGPFPRLEKHPYLESGFVRSLPEDMRLAIREHGIRNSHLIAIAPAGSISLLAGNVSSGIEPVFSGAYRRKIRTESRAFEAVDVEDYSLAKWRERGEPGMPPAFMTATQIAPIAHIDMQAAVQPFVDNAISKTVNMPEMSSVDDVRSVFDAAYDKGLKGCSVFRPNPVTGEILSARRNEARPPACSGTV